MNLLYTAGKEYIGLTLPSSSFSLFWRVHLLHPLHLLLIMHWAERVRTGSRIKFYACATCRSTAIWLVDAVLPSSTKPLLLFCKNHMIWWSVLARVYFSLWNPTMAMLCFFNFASLVLVCLVLSFPPSNAAADPSTTTDLLWPLPRKVTFGSSIYSLQSSSFQFLGSGAGGASIILKDAFVRYLFLIFETPVPFYPSGSGGSSAGVLQSVTVDVKSNNETLGPDTDESCKLLS